jgi:hypothetical protein
MTKILVMMNGKVEMIILKLVVIRPIKKRKSRNILKHVNPMRLKILLGLF